MIIKSVFRQVFLQNLFLIYCTYVYNNCVKDFDVNYQSEIYQLRMLYEVQDNEK